MNQPQLTWVDVDRILQQVSAQGRTFRLVPKGDGFLLQVEYLEPDVQHPDAGPVLQRGRKWYVSSFSTPTEVVETAWAAVQRSVLHQAAEHFTYKGRRIYSRHFAVNARLDLCDENRFDGRVPR